MAQLWTAVFAVVDSTLDIVKGDTVVENKSSSFNFMNSQHLWRPSVVHKDV